MESKTVTTDLVPLVVAAQLLGLRYAAALDRVLVGSLRGTRIGAHWFVYRKALEHEGVQTE